MWLRYLMWVDAEGRPLSGSVAAYNDSGEKVGERVPPSPLDTGENVHGFLEALVEAGLDTWGVQGALF